MTDAPMSELAAALQEAQESSTTGGGWPEQLTGAQQDAWMLLVDVEALLVGLAQNRLAAGRVEAADANEAARLLDDPILQAWSAEEVDRWRRVAELLSSH